MTVEPAIGLVASLPWMSWTAVLGSPQKSVTTSWSDAEPSRPSASVMVSGTVLRPTVVPGGTVAA